MLARKKIMYIIFLLFIAGGAKFAQENQIDIHGHLWIFDQMILEQTITGLRAAQKLTELCELINPRLGLPKKECDRRIKEWTSSSR